MSLYLDTNIFLNVIYKEPKFKDESAELLNKIQTQEVQAVTSSVTVLEIMLDIAKSGFADLVEVAVAAVEDLRGLNIVPLDKEMSKLAAEHVLQDKLTIHDAYHLATALHSNVSYFVTRDHGLSKKIERHVKTIFPDDLALSGSSD